MASARTGHVEGSRVHGVKPLPELRHGLRRPENAQVQMKHGPTTSDRFLESEEGAAREAGRSRRCRFYADGALDALLMGLPGQDVTSRPKPAARSSSPCWAATVTRRRNRGRPNTDPVAMALAIPNATGELLIQPGSGCRELQEVPGS